MRVPEGEVLGVKLLVGGGVDDLGVELLLVGLGVETAPVNGLAAAGGQADTVDVEGVEFGSLLGQGASQRHLPHLELVLCVANGLLLFPFSILLANTHAHQYTHD
jgi:hypothetical protein